MALTTPAVIKPEKHRVNVVIRIFCKSIIACILKLIDCIIVIIIVKHKWIYFKLNDFQWKCNIKNYRKWKKLAINYRIIYKYQIKLCEKLKYILR